MPSRRRQHSLHFLITAGGTREYIDPVRFISNASSGRMGYALAKAALAAGHKVTLVTAPTCLRVPAAAEVVAVESAEEMFKAVRKHFAGCDCLIMAAAVADYTPARRFKNKIKKKDTALDIKLKPTVDILKWAGKHKKKGQKIIGFALEQKSIESRAEKKLKEKNLDVIVANTPRSIGEKRADFQIKTPGADWLSFPNITKRLFAGKLIRFGE